MRNKIGLIHACIGAALELKAQTEQNVKQKTKLLQCSIHSVKKTFEA